MMVDPISRTTIALQSGLLAATDRAVTAGKAKNRTELITDHQNKSILFYP